jgi:hypothetical protein
MEYTKEEIEKFKAKADKWDALDERISVYYRHLDPESGIDDPEEEGDLCTIGELAASAFGYF